MPAALDLRNRTWITAHALPLVPGAAGSVGTARVEDSLDRAYESRWYVLKGLSAGDDVTVTLTLPPGFTEDYTLLGFTDIRVMAARLLAQLGTTGPLDADDMDSDDMDSDDMDSDDMDSDDMDSDDMDSDDMDSGDLGSDPISDIVREQLNDVYASAQRHSLRSASVTPGPADEQIHMTARAGGGDLYFRVRGHHGAFSARPYQLDVIVVREDVCGDLEACPQRSAIPSDVLGQKRDVLILTHTGRPSLGLPDDEARDTFVKRTLGDLAARVNGSVYDLRRDTRLARLYAEWELQPAKRCVAFANVIVESIREIIADFAAHNPLRYVVLVGGDDVIPFARIEDRAEISREWQWAGPYDSETPLGAALTYGYFLSDDPYGRSGPLDQRGKNVRTPTIAVGRLVESVDDIRAYLDWYARQGCLRGCVGAFLPWLGKRTATIKLESALVTGYTFVHDLGDQVKGALANAGTSVDDSLVNDVWTADQLASKIKDRNQLIAAQGHYSANTLVPAAAGTPKLVPTDPSIAKGDLAGRIWLTIGCHSGHNIVDRETRQAYRHPTSWPEALLRKGVTLIGGTGYQYAESVLLENSEKLYAYLTQELVGASEVAIGAALIAAKQRYLTQCLQVRGIDEKLLAVSILYGLPMLKVRPKTAVKPAQLTPVVGTPAKTSKSGIRTRQIELVSGLSDSDVKQLDGRDYFEASGQRVARPLRPVLPAVYRDITAGDHRPMGLLWTEGTYVENDHHPLIALPVLEERSAKRPRYRNRAFLPTRPFRVARAGASQTLVFTPMQYRYERPDPPEGRRRLWQSAKATVYYSSRTDRSALLDAPALRDPRLAVVSGRLDATIAVRHYDSEAEDVQVFASYFDGSNLRTVALTAAAPSAADGIGFVRTFNGSVPAVPGVAPEQQRVFFQAVGANGRVSALMNGGRLFGVSRAATQATTLSLQAQATAGYRERIQVTAKLALAATGAAADGEVLFRLGGSRLWARTAGGVATVTLNVATRPRTGTSYRVTASFPGEGDLSGSSASGDVIVGKARTELIGESGITLVRGGRTAVARLQLASDPVRVLGLRPIVLRPGKDERVAYTDQDGVLRVEPSEVGEGDEVELRFEGDDRYESASATVRIGRVSMRS